MVGRTNVGGGGGGLPSSDAVLHIRALEGSTIEILKNSILIAQLSPDDSHASVTDAHISEWYYTIKSSNYGDFSVNAILSGETKSASVTIDTNKQYDLNLARKWIYNNGDTCGFTWSKSQSGGTATLTVGESYIELKAPASVYGWGAIDQSIDITPYKKLWCYVSYRSNTDARNRVYTSPNKFTETTAYAQNAAVGWLSVDVSSRTGNYFVGLYTWHNHTFRTTQIYLDP